MKHIFLFAILAFSTNTFANNARPAHGICGDETVKIDNFHTVKIAGVDPQESYECDKNAQPQVYRGARPDRNGIEELVRLKVKTVVNLENIEDMNPNESAWVNGRMNYYSFPMAKNGPAPDETVAAALAVITNPDNYPVFIHCKHGIDRTGFMVAYLRVFDGWKAARAIAEWSTFRNIRSAFSSGKQFEWGKEKINDLENEMNGSLP